MKRGKKITFLIMMILLLAVVFLSVRNTGKSDYEEILEFEIADLRQYAGIEDVSLVPIEFIDQNEYYIPYNQSDDLEEKTKGVELGKFINSLGVKKINGEYNGSCLRFMTNNGQLVLGYVVIKKDTAYIITYYPSQDRYTIEAQDPDKRFVKRRTENENGVEVTYNDVYFGEEDGEKVLIYRTKSIH